MDKKEIYLYEYNRSFLSSFVCSRRETFSMGQIALKVDSYKMKKHEQTCMENQHVFIQCTFDTFGFFTLDVEKLHNRVVQQVIHSNAITPKIYESSF